MTNYRRIVRARQKVSHFSTRDHFSPTRDFSESRCRFCVVVGCSAGRVFGPLGWTLRILCAKREASFIEISAEINGRVLRALDGIAASILKIKLLKFN